MQIRYFGHSYVVVMGKEFDIALDPFKNIGLKEIPVSVDFLFCSHEHFDHNNKAIVVYDLEVKGTAGPFKVYEGFHDNQGGALRGNNNIIRFKLEDKEVAFLGDLGEKENEDIVNFLKDVDVMFIPIGGNYTIDAIDAKWYIDRINAKITIPVHFKVDGSTVDIEDEKRFLSLFDNYKEVEKCFEVKDESGIVFIKP